jgi:hypothetical protein
VESFPKRAWIWKDTPSGPPATRGGDEERTNTTKIRDDPMSIFVLFNPRLILISGSTLICYTPSLPLKSFYQVR